MVKLGKGILTWERGERVSDRYGTVYLIEDGHTSRTVVDSPSLIETKGLKGIEGQEGTLIATVIEPRKSTHIGDFFRGFYPSIPNKGEEITLGTGTFFSGNMEFDWGMKVGLQPDDGRVSDWLNPEALYRAHEQLVSLEFHTI